MKISRFIKTRTKKMGTPPGSLVHIGEEKYKKVEITIIDYDEHQFQEKEIENIEECFQFKDKPSVTWININGIHQPDIIEKIGNYFDVHPLVLEDIMNTDQRPKFEDLEKYIFIVLKMIYLGGNGKEIQSEQISLILGSNFAISLQEKKGDVFNTIRDRIRNQKGRIRKMGADYLSYTLVDAIVDNYFVILESYGDKIEEIEENVLLNPVPEIQQTIQSLKREMMFLRKSIWPFREVINGLEKSESRLIKKSTIIYLRDVYDHTIQVIDTIETFRDMTSGLMDIYLSSLSNKMNEVMKVLTIIATIFIPLTFIAGIYGMNFKFMPELDWKMGYFFIWSIMLVVGLIMVIFFKRKKWL